tara:strand:+ start:494 stop:982 length:489 start_codon:yes stop_codon:yes gene_type:complete
MPDHKNKKHRDTIRINKPSKIYKPGDFVTEDDFEKQFAQIKGDSSTFPQSSVEDYSTIQTDDKGPYVVRNSSNQLRKRGTDNRVVKGSKEFVNKQSSDDPNHIAESMSKSESGSAIYAKISSACKAAAKRKFKVWPSAYASGWGVRCTKAGGPSNFGGKKKK